MIIKITTIVDCNEKCVQYNSEIVIPHFCNIFLIYSTTISCRAFCVHHLMSIRLYCIVFVLWNISSRCMYMMQTVDVSMCVKKRLHLWMRHGKDQHFWHSGNHRKGVIVYFLFIMKLSLFYEIHITIIYWVILFLIYFRRFTKVIHVGSRV